MATNVVIARPTGGAVQVFGVLGKLARPPIRQNEEDRHAQNEPPKTIISPSNRGFRMRMSREVE